MKVRAAQALRSVDVVAVPVPSDALGKPIEGVAEVPWRFLKSRGFSGKVGETVAVPDGGGRAVLYVGVGPAAAVDATVLRRAAGAAARAVGRARTLCITLPAVAGSERLRSMRAVAEGVVLGGYRYDALRTKNDKPALREAVIVDPSGKVTRDSRDAVASGVAAAEAACLARDLVNEPGGALTAPVFAERAAEVAATAGLEAKVHDEKAIRKLGLGGLLAVNRGSALPPRFVEITYEPADTADAGAVALVGKGITFDSGGLSIKPADGMTTMKCDMAGAAAVLGALSACAALDVQVPVRGYLPMTDNMLGGDATRVGDVVQHYGGSTTEVLNTDAEGRLILADALVYATESRSGHDAPAVVVDLATLTGACAVALGTRTAGLFSTDDSLAAEVLAAADAAGEGVWRMPMPEAERKRIESKIADRKNVGHRYGGAIHAGWFLRDFVGDVPWAHLDIAGPAFNEDADDAEIPSGGTGFGVRTLLEVLSASER